jgi:DNA-directed RNA polymerase alpha subunit
MLCVQAEGMTSLDDIRNRTTAELAKMPNINMKTLREICDLLDRKQPKDMRDARRMK